MEQLHSRFPPPDSPSPPAAAEEGGCAEGEDCEGGGFGRGGGSARPNFRSRLLMETALLRYNRVMLEKTSVFVSAVCLTVYWFWVVVKLVRVGRRIGKDPNAMPREMVGILLRLIWYPCVIVLLVALWVAAVGSPEWGSRHFLWRLELLGVGGVLAEGLAALVVLGCTGATFVCWYWMGRSWRIGIDPSEKLDMVRTGPFGLVRHPIYALRLVINTCVIVLVPTVWVIAAAAVDMLLLQIEAAAGGEVHGEQARGGLRAV